MKTPLHIGKLLLAGLLAVPLAVLSGAHALSSASLRNAPELSRSVFPRNGLASEKLVYRMFADGVRKSLVGPLNQKAETGSAEPEVAAQLAVSVTDLQVFALDAVPSVREALQSEPLLPKAHALLALAETDPQRRRQIIALASGLNRRELALQGLVLQQKVDDGDYAGTIGTLDQILRVHPERQAEFFPLLSNALAQSATRAAFTTLLSKPLPWRDAFLGYAVGEAKVLDNLAVIRQDIDLDNLAFDQRLIAGLVAQGNIEAARRVYEIASPQKPNGIAGLWQSQYPPLEWRLTDTTGLRAQASKDLAALEFSIDPGNGGVLASRLFPTPLAPFELRVGHRIEPAAQIKDMKIQLTCWGQPAPFYEKKFSRDMSIFQIGSRPACAYIEVAVAGRAWTGSGSLSGELGSFVISSK